MTATFAPATPGGVPLILGIAGPSRSGKTYSALRIALGLVGGEPSRVFVIDTERGRARQYADKFGGFLHCLLDPPFAYSRYAEMIAAAVKDGAGVVVVDSASHAHEGEGGMLDQHEAELDRMAADDWQKRERAKFTAWIKPKRALGEFVHQLMRVEVPVICCFRAKERLRMQKNTKGRQEPVPIGLRAICSDELTFEMSSLFMLPEGAKGVPDLDAPGTGLREPIDAMTKRGDQLSEDFGKSLAKWMDVSPAPASINDAQVDVLNDLADTAGADKARFCAHYGISAIPELPAAKFDDASRLLSRKIEKHEREGMQDG